MRGTHEQVELDGHLYDIIDPPKHITQEELNESSWASHWLHGTTCDGEVWYLIGDSALVQLVDELSGRFTNISENWKSNGLRSLLEVVTGVTVFVFAYTTTHAPVFSAALGTACACGAMLINSMLSLFAVHASRASWASGILRTCGFQVDSGCARRQQLRSIKTVFFGYAGLDAIRYIITNESDVSSTAAMVTATTIALVAAAEVLTTSWRPTAKIAATLETRWTHIGQNWTTHPMRSFCEVACWCLAIMGAFMYSNDLLWSCQAGTAAAIAVCLAGGCEDDTESGDCCADDDVVPGLARTSWGEIMSGLASIGSKFSFESHAQDVLDGFSA